MKGHFIIEQQFDEAQEIDRIGISKSKNQVDARCQDVLRRPKMLPVEEDITLVRDYTVANIETRAKGLMCLGLRDAPM